MIYEAVFGLLHNNDIIHLAVECDIEVRNIILSKPRDGWESNSVKGS